MDFCMWLQVHMLDRAKFVQTYEAYLLADSEFWKCQILAKSNKSADAPPRPSGRQGRVSQV